ncbi:MAG: sigma-54-dependent Fis family transcriptional regulator [Desulfobacteraceae bacterium]|nr:sigma-54-dependent Fis family transcriptional regulator [Desulfobacteraceae bacterium]
MMELVLEYSIAIFEKDRQKRDYLRRKVSASGYTPVCFENEGMCLENLRLIKPTAVLFEPNSVDTATRLLHLISIINKDLPVLFYSKQKKIKKYIKDIKLTKVSVVDEAFEEKIHQTITEENDREIKIKQVVIGSSSDISKIKKIIPVIGASNEPVLIQGEPGVGKELIARAIINVSGKKDDYSIKVDASQITRRNMENDLFCFIKDESDGNKTDGDGNCSILLDNFEKLEKDAQAELLLLAESLNNAEKENTRKKNGFRFISTASGNIEQLIRNDDFRKDLYYRLGVLKIYVPPLRKRIEDITDLADYFALKFSLSQNKTYYKLPEYIQQMFVEYHWPGNVQELSNIVKRLVVNEDEASIVNYINKLCNVKKKPFASKKKLIGEYFDEINEVKKNIMGKKDIHLKEISEEISSKTEIKLLSHALYKTNWNRKKAAEMLKISYKALLNKIKIYKLDLT